MGFAGPHHSDVFLLSYMRHLFLFTLEVIVVVLVYEISSQVDVLSCVMLNA